VGALAGADGGVAASAGRSELDWANDGAQNPSAAQAIAARTKVAFIARS
jgi:hypothetical protein